MPTIFYKLRFRFYFVSFDCSEPPHIHVGDDVRKICKYWLKNNKAVLVDNHGFTKRELGRVEIIIRRVEIIINENYQLLLKSFHEFCKGYKK